MWTNHEIDTGMKRNSSAGTSTVMCVCTDTSTKNENEAL